MLSRLEFLRRCTFFNQIDIYSAGRLLIQRVSYAACCLEEEDLYHMVTRCPAFHDIRMSSVERLKQIVVEQSGGSVWCSTFESWDTILKVLICPDCVTPLVPGLSDSLNNIEKVSKTFFSTKYILKD